jgi:hypothetical protein
MHITVYMTHTHTNTHEKQVVLGGLVVIVLATATNVVVELLTLLFCIRKVQGSNLGLEIRYPDLGFAWFPQVPPGECRDNILN